LVSSFVYTSTLFPENIRALPKKKKCIISQRKIHSTFLKIFACRLTVENIGKARRIEE
jgi:hypothetical protein